MEQCQLTSRAPLFVSRFVCGGINLRIVDEINFSFEGNVGVLEEEIAGFLKPYVSIKISPI